MATNLTLTTPYLNVYNGTIGTPPAIFANGQVTTFAGTAVIFMALGDGLCIVNSNLVNGTAYTSLATTGLTKAITAGESLTLTSSIHTQVITAAANASIGATTISVNSFVANFNYGTVPTSLISTPLVTNTVLDHERFRVAYATGQAGSAPGEFDMTIYVSPNQANNFVIAEIGFFDDSSGVTDAGVLLARGPFSLGTGQKTTLQSIQFKLAIIPTSTY